MKRVRIKKVELNSPKPKKQWFKKLKEFDVKSFFKHPSVLTMIVIVFVVAGAIVVGCTRSTSKESNLPNVEIEAVSGEDVENDTFTEEGKEKAYEGKVENDEIKNAEENKEITSSAILTYNEDNGFGYLNNCVFLGDSRTVGMVNYRYISDEDALAKVGVAHTDVERITFSQNSGKQYTVKQFLASCAKDVVFVCYGVNGMDSIPEDKYKQSYTTLVDDIISWAPKSTIVLMAIWPVDDNGTYKGKVKNEWIDKYNEFLLNLAEEKGIRYLDVDTVLKNENGSIKAEYDGGDGLHYRSDAYKIILDYIVTHPVPGVSHAGEYKVHYVKPSKEYTDIVANPAATPVVLPTDLQITATPSSTTVTETPTASTTSSTTNQTTESTESTAPVNSESSATNASASQSSSTTDSGSTTTTTTTSSSSTPVTDTSSSSTEIPSGDDNPGGNDNPGGGNNDPSNGGGGDEPTEPEITEEPNTPTEPVATPGGTDQGGDPLTPEGGE
ncbi:MAG: SGNH/GDSL hydrolase family protein [Lachnospiraceae bacterium]|nr:SGNH/GDSL hydrolase family protein [Lachnospiraceae bacterium]